MSATREPSSHRRVLTRLAATFATAIPGHIDTPVGRRFAVRPGAVSYVPTGATGSRSEPRFPIRNKVNFRSYRPDDVVRLIEDLQLNASTVAASIGDLPSHAR